MNIFGKPVKKTNGFTLIELLVVIAIIGILASVVIVSINTARKKARDAQRIRNIEEIHTAIELYINANGDAPDTGSNGVTAHEFYDYNSEWTDLQTALAPYIKSLPHDPCGQSCPAADRSNYFAYGYEGPTMVNSLRIAYTVSGYPNYRFSSSYIIFANRLETKTGNFGFGLFSF